MTTHKTITPGKFRAMQKCSTSDGLFGILAIDHQDALKRSLKPDAPETCTPDELTDFKLEVVSALHGHTTGVLLDPVYGAGQALARHTIHNTGLLVELEKADYALDPLPLDVEIMPGWSVNKIKKIGADGAKLFFYYNPHNHDHAARQDAIVKQVIAECGQYDIPLYAEPIIYQTDEKYSKRDLVIESARRIAAAGADALKLEFPLDVDIHQDERIWRDACEELTAAIDVPWVLLSAGVSFDVFARQVKIACKAGAAGFIVGRAVWGDVAGITDKQQRQTWYEAVGQHRLNLLNAITAMHGQSWHETYTLPDIDTDWCATSEEMRL